MTDLHKTERKLIDTRRRVFGYTYKELGEKANRLGQLTGYFKLTDGKLSNFFNGKQTLASNQLVALHAVLNIEKTCL